MRRSSVPLEQGSLEESPQSDSLQSTVAPHRGLTEGLRTEDCRPGEEMPRRARVEKREVAPDPRFGSRTLTRFMNKLMLNGKKSLAERIVYGALDSIERTSRRSPLDVFDTALRNATPLLEVKPRRV